MRFKVRRIQRSSSWVQERVERGLAARKRLPRTELASWSAPEGRADPVDILETQSADRLQDLVPVRYGRMLQSPFAFYRGSAAVMAADLATGPTTGLTVQLCGDAHLSNFGLYAAPDRGLLFGINDFDETLPGPFEWDVKRLAASFSLFAQQVGFSTAARRAGLMTLGRSYRDHLFEFGSMRELDLWYYRIEAEHAVAAVRNMAIDMRTVNRAILRAESRDHLRAFKKLTAVNGARRSIVMAPPLIVPAHPEDFESIQLKFDEYLQTVPPHRRKLLERYRLVDVARKVVGVGSVGTRCWIALFEGRDERDPLFLQMKEATPSVLEPWLGQSEFENHGERVVVGQRLTQAASDIFLGSASGRDGRCYYWRQLWDKKGAVEPVTERGFSAYAMVCGWALARAHAKTGDAISIAAYIGGGDRFVTAMADYADSYAKQAVQDHTALAEALRQGRIRAIQGI